MATCAHVRSDADHEAAQQAADYLLGDAREETGDGPDTKLTFGHKHRQGVVSDHWA